MKIDNYPHRNIWFPVYEPLILAPMYKGEVDYDAFDDDDYQFWIEEVLKDDIYVFAKESLDNLTTTDDGVPFIPLSFGILRRAPFTFDVLDNFCKEVNCDLKDVTIGIADSMVGPILYFIVDAPSEANEF